MTDTLFERDHHHLKITVPVHREAARRWVACAMAAAVVFLVPVPGGFRLAAAVLLFALAWWARDRRNTVLDLTHDTLDIHTTRLGRPEIISTPWDGVGIDSSTNRLELTLGGEPFVTQWSGSAIALAECVTVLQEAKTRFRSPEPVPEPPRALSHLRAPEGAP